LDVGVGRQALGEGGFERAVELNGVDLRDPLGQVGGEDAEPRADLEHDVLGTELREAADHAEEVLVDEEVLAELLLGRREPHGSATPKRSELEKQCRTTVAAKASSAAAVSSSAARVWTTTGLPSSAASSSWRANRSRWRSCGA